jgi:hypothetical protein
MSESIKASPELMLFFKKLLKLKQYIEGVAIETNSFILHDIHEKLNDLIKQDEEEENDE